MPKKEEKMLFSCFYLYKTISLRPELSSSPRFRIQGGRGGTLSVTAEHAHAEILVSKNPKKMLDSKCKKIEIPL